MDGLISNIQKFSLDDGPGIRTTVFLKGCNFKCIWCHNPEAISFQPEELYYAQKCIHCGHCKDGCPTGARSIVGEYRSPQSVFEEIYSDLDYYKASSGGITVSGGEPLGQIEFLEELLKICKEAHIDTAIETNLSYPFNLIERIIPYLDHIYYDLKIMNDTEHLKYIGVSNKSVLENSQKLDRAGVPVIVRTPLIPGITDSMENLCAIIYWLRDMKNLIAWEILNYNVLAKAKYAPLQQEYKLPDARPLPLVRINEIKDFAVSHNIPIIYNPK